MTKLNKIIHKLYLKAVGFKIEFVDDYDLGQYEVLEKYPFYQKTVKFFGNTGRSEISGAAKSILGT